MNSLKRTSVNGLILVCAATLLFGCSAIGSRNGAPGEPGSPRLSNINATDFRSLAPGSRISITKKNGEVLTGMLKATRRTDSEYRMLYNDCNQDDYLPFPLPAIGPVTLTRLADGSTQHVILNGFDFEGVVIRNSASEVPLLIGYGDLAGFAMIDTDGWRIPIADIQPLALSGELPIYSVIKLQTGTAELTIDLHEIATLVPAKPLRPGGGWSLLFEAFVDLTLLVVAAGALNSINGSVGN